MKYYYFNFVGKGRPREFGDAVTSEFGEFLVASAKMKLRKKYMVTDSVISGVLKITKEDFLELKHIEI
jgi:hypothetical protein